jgi:hypothetical protein
VKDDPNNDDNNPVRRPMTEVAERSNMGRPYGPDPDFDAVLSRWNESAG